MARKAKVSLRLHLFHRNNICPSVIFSMVINQLLCLLIHHNAPFCRLGVTKIIFAHTVQCIPHPGFSHLPLLFQCPGKDFIPGMGLGGTDSLFFSRSQIKVRDNWRLDHNHFMIHIFHCHAPAVCICYSQMHHHFHRTVKIILL